MYLIFILLSLATNDFQVLTPPMSCAHSRSQARAKEEGSVRQKA